MPPKRPAKTAAVINTNYSDDSEDSDTNQKPKKSAKNHHRTSRPVEPPPEFSDEAVSDNDIYDDDNRAYMKIANEVVLKNVVKFFIKLPALFDPNVLPGFSALINNTSKISAASRVLEASFKVFGKRVDVVHTEARKLDHDVITRTVEDDEKKKKKPADEDEEEDVLNESLNDWAGEGGGNDPAFFSEDDEATVTQKKEKHKELKNMNVDMTMAHFDFDENVSMPSDFALTSNSDSSFQLNDDNNLRKKLMAISNDRTVLMGNQKRSLKEIEKRLRRANEAAMEYYRKEMLRRGINKGSRKEAAGEDERSNEDYSQFHNSYFQYALNKKREKRHICIDDVAATTVDHSRVYMHNEWCDEEDGMPPSSEDKNGPDDGSFLYYPNPILTTQEDEDAQVDDIDILDGVLEQFQGLLNLLMLEITVFLFFRNNGIGNSVVA
uniref:Uncharacterized protein n=1 Tax=Panagrolaimus superbus TaxID=310955 RepID=A0A914Y444_9BILA